MFFAPTITLSEQNSILTKFIQSQMEFVKYRSDNRPVRCQNLCVRLFLCFKTKLPIIFIVWLYLYFHNNNNNMSIDFIPTLFIVCTHIQDCLIKRNRKKCQL